MVPWKLLCAVLLLSTAQEGVTVESNKTKESQGDMPPAQVTTRLQETTAPTIKETLPPALTEVGNPVIAAKQVQGSSGLGKTPLVVEPDAIKKVLGVKCSVAEDCKPINNSVCVDTRCVCAAGYIPSRHSMDKCVKVPTGLGDVCEEEAQCSHVVPDSQCHSGVCDCPTTFIFDQGRCWEKQELGGVCNNSMQCGDTISAVCVQGVCACEPHLIPSPVNKCLEPAESVYLAACVEDIQCMYTYGNEARCSNNQCRCTNDYHFNGTKCIPDKKLKDLCESHEDCAVSETNQEGSRMCLDKSCACAEGYQSLFGEDICTKSSGEELAVSLAWIISICVAKFYLS